jgi:type IV pilus assembly protein PilC
MIVIRALKLLLIGLVGALAIMLAAAIWLIPTGNGALTALLTVTSLCLCAAIAIVLVWLMVEAVQNRRHVGQILAYIEQAVRLNLPLPQTLQAIATGEPGSMATHILRAKIALEQGEPLAVALEALPNFPARIIGLLAAAERVGRLPQVLARLVDQRRARHRNDTRGPAWIPFYRTYPFMVSIALIAVTSMLMIFVMPKLEQIFKDFRIELPPVTLITLDISRNIGPWISLLLLVILLAGMFGAIRARWSGGAYGLAEGPGRWILNRLPWIGRMRSYHALGESLEFSAEAIDGGRPIENSLAEAAPLAGNPIVRRQLRQWADLLTRGQALTESARAARMPRLVVGMMNTAVQSADVVQIFRFLGRYYATRFSRAMALLEGAFVPAVVFVMGSFVAWLALSLFLPLVTLINTLATTRFRP